MKRDIGGMLAAGVVAALIVAGCETTPDTTQGDAPSIDGSGKYAIQIIEANIKGDGLTELMPELFWDPNTESIEGLDAISSKDIFSPEREVATNVTIKPPKTLLPRPKIQQATIDKILAMPEATYEYPLLHATLGVKVVCDQTEAREVPKDYAVIDGQTVKTLETVKLGHYAEAILQTTANAYLTCNLKVENKSLFGTETYTLENGDQVEMPYFDCFSISGAAVPVSEAWAMQAISIGEETENGTTIGTAHLIFIRAIPNRSAEIL